MQTDPKSPFRYPTASTPETTESLSRPGGNATGFVLFEYDLSANWLELLKEIAPDVEITADCPKKKAHNWNDQCAARCPDLPR